MSIPKKIHYCWFGNAPIGRKMAQCMKSWATFCPDYEVVRWDESNAPLDNNDYVRQAYRAQKWAFVSDYVRLCTLCVHGGIYLDTDVELLKPLDSLLTCKSFMGFESNDKIATCMIAAQPGHPFFIEASQQYEKRQFLTADGRYDDTTNVEILTDMFTQAGLLKNNMLQEVRGVTVYPTEFFSPKNLETGKIKITQNSYAIHYFNASWMSAAQRLNTKLAQVLGPKVTRDVKRWLRKT